MSADVIDVALGKSASQSSLSQWSQPDEATYPVSGREFSDFAFHTEFEDNPWWSVDLGSVLPIDAIVVHNRVGASRERAARLRVEIAETPDRWMLIHAGYCLFGGGGNGEPLRLAIGSHLRGRYVRLSLDDRQYLHLSKVEIFARAEVLALSAYCTRHGLELCTPNPSSSHGLDCHPHAPRDAIIGLKLIYPARFGNLFIQYLNAIQLAERTNLKYIQLSYHDLFEVNSDFSVNNIHFIPPNEPLPPVGVFLTGVFFGSDGLEPILSPTLKFGLEEERDIHRICQTYIIPHILTGIPTSTEKKASDELTVHIRAGDIFNPAQFVPGNYHGYRQPPLSFYILVVERMRKAGRIARVRLVYEDRANPCIQAFETWLDAKGIPYRTQSVSLRDDMSALVDADHLVFGHGTYGYAACRLSRQIKTVHFFAPQLGGAYEYMPNIGEVYSVSDARGQYMRAYEYGKPLSIEEAWRFEPEMYERMLDYPIEALELKREK